MATFDEPRVLLLSVKPRWSKLIMNGKKTLELRRVYPYMEVPARVAIYESAPTKAIVGVAECYGGIAQDVDTFSKYERDRACVSRKELNEYFAGKRRGYALCLRNAAPLAKPVSLSRMRSFGITAPQSYRFLSVDMTSKLFTVWPWIEVPQ